jgi:hypothetical protein
MAKAKRARNVETLKQPSLRLRLRASYFYPDIRESGSVRGEERNLLTYSTKANS